MVVNIDKFIDETEAAALGGGIPIGTISRSPEVVLPIAAVTQPTLSTLPGSSIDTHDHPDGSTTGLRFEFTVPDDYDTGNLAMSIIFAMSTSVASPNNVVRLEVAAEIAKASDGTIDTASYPPTPLSVTTPDGSTDVDRSVTILSISDGDFAAGDKLLFFVKRLGADGGDLHTGILKIADYMVAYTGQISTRSLVMDFEVFSDTDEPGPPAGTKSTFDTLDFQTALDQEQKLQFPIPDNWDGVSDFHFQFTYAMSTAATLVVALETEGEVANVSTGAIDVLAVEPFVINTTSDTNVHRTTVVRSVPATGRQAGDVISLKFARRGNTGPDTHTGNWQVISGTVAIGTGPSTGVSVLSEVYLGPAAIRQVAGTTASAVEAPDLSGDFELYTFLSATAVSSQINGEWAGRLASNQTKVTSIKVPIKGNAGAEYQFKVFVEGGGPTPVFDSSLTAAPLTRTLVSLTQGDLSAQPITEGRFFVVVEAHLDSGEELRVGTPFVKQE